MAAAEFLAQLLLGAPAIYVELSIDMPEPYGSDLRCVPVSAERFSDLAIFWGSLRLALP